MGLEPINLLNFYSVSSSFTEVDFIWRINPVLAGTITGFYRVLPGFTRFQRVFIGLNPIDQSFYWVLPSFTELDYILNPFDPVLLISITGFYRVLPSFA